MAEGAMNWVIGICAVGVVLWLSRLMLPLENKRMEARAKVSQRKRELGIEEVPML
jgi:hypothetical protein